MTWQDEVIRDWERYRAEHPEPTADWQRDQGGLAILFRRAIFMALRHYGVDCSPEDLSRISMCSSADQLYEWALRIPTAKGIDEVFAQAEESRSDTPDQHDNGEHKSRA